MNEEEELVEIQPAVAEKARSARLIPVGSKPKDASTAKPVSENRSALIPAVASGAMPKVAGATLSGVRPAAATGILPVSANPALTGARTAVGPAAGNATAFNPKVTSSNPAVGSQSGVFKRKDPRAQSVIVPAVRKEEPGRLRALMVRVMWGSAALLLLLVISTGCYNLYLHFQNEKQQQEKEFLHNSDMAELLDRMSAMEAEVKTQRALIRQQETELKAAKNELSNYARTNDTLLRRLSKQKAP